MLPCFNPAVEPEAALNNAGDASVGPGFVLRDSSRQRLGQMRLQRRFVSGKSGWIPTTASVAWFSHRRSQIVFSYVHILFQSVVVVVVVGSAVETHELRTTQM